MLRLNDQELGISNREIDSNFVVQSSEATRLYATVTRTMREDVRDVIKCLIRAFKRGNKVILFGNGGSCADAQHIAGEFLGKCIRDSPSLPALALHANTSVVTAIANDYSFDEIFSRQIIGLANPRDVVIGFSTSGNSINVKRGIGQANILDLETIGFLGNDGGCIKNLVDYPLIVPSQVTPRIQEVHILLGHIICVCIEDYFIQLVKKSGNRAESRGLVAVGPMDLGLK